MKNSKTNVYDNEYYEKKYNKYKQKYLSASGKQYGGRQRGGVFTLDNIVSFDREFRFNSKIENIKDLNSDKIIVREKAGDYIVAKKIISDDNKTPFTYSPQYALIDDNFKINSCIPYNLRPVSIFLSLLCKISEHCKCSESVCTEKYGLYKNHNNSVYDPKYYEPMVPVIKVVNHIPNFSEVKDDKYGTFLCGVEEFIDEKFKPKSNSSSVVTNIIKDYLDTTRIYTTIPNLLNLIVELRNVSSFSHKYFSRISHLRTLPIKLFLNVNDERNNNFDNITAKDEYYVSMKETLLDNIPVRLEKIHRFIINSKPFLRDNAFSEEQKIKIKESVTNKLCTFNNNFFASNSNDLCDLLTHLYKIIDVNSKVEKDTTKKEITIECFGKKTTRDLDYINITTYNSGVRLHELIYDATKTLLTYLSYKELEKTCIFIRKGYPLLYETLMQIPDADRNKSLEVLSTDVFITQKGCFLCETKKSGENFDVVAATDVNDVYFISLCGFDFSTVPSTRDNKSYLNGELNNHDNVRILGRFYDEYLRIFTNLLLLCENEKIKYLSMVPFGVGVFLDGLAEKEEDLKPYLIMYVSALRTALLKSDHSITLYVSFGRIKTQLLEIFGKKDGNFPEINNVKKITNVSQIEIPSGVAAEENTEITVNKSIVVLHGKDAKTMAIELRRKYADSEVGFINASDFIALIFGKIGYYTLDGYSDRYAGEEDFACTSTGMLACDDVYKSLGFDIDSTATDGPSNTALNSTRKRQLDSYVKNKGDKKIEYEKKLGEAKKSKDPDMANAAQKVDKAMDNSRVPPEIVPELQTAITNAIENDDPKQMEQIAHNIEQGKPEEVIQHDFKIGKLNPLTP